MPNDSNALDLQINYNRISKYPHKKIRHRSILNYF